MKGQGNQQDYGMRIYDPRLGRFLSVDPITKDYPWYTPYQFAGNKPIAFIDLDGLEEARKGVVVKADEYLEANHPILAGIQNGIYNLATATGINLMDDMLQEVTWGQKGQQSWPDVGKGLVNTFFKTTAPFGIPIAGVAPGPKVPPAPAVALTVEGGTVVVATPPKALIVNPPSAVVILGANLPKTSVQASNKGGKGPNDKGTQAEKEGGADPRAGRPSYIGPVTGKPRLSDINTSTTLGEIKGNYNYVQWLSSQIKDGMMQALIYGKEYQLILANPEKVTKPLKEAFEKYNKTGGKATITGTGH